ncbi:MAG: SCP2 sterol-binding domain-containing protein [Alphaproteobacteria bacterium]|jgi:putative sterol carrier protein|nr:SCP2 sterol-binding domain-containing protein [Alphaproteobacteria bacterium]
MSFETIAGEIRSHLMNFAGLGYKIKFAFNEGGVLLLDGTATPPTLSEEDGEADCVIGISEDNAVKLMNGQLNPMLAYSMGKLKIDGSIGVALKMASMMEG